MTKLTKAELVDELDSARRFNEKLLERMDSYWLRVEQLTDVVEEYDHALHSVADGVRDVLNGTNKFFDADRNAYYATWYWVEWGKKVCGNLHKQVTSVEWPAAPIPYIAEEWYRHVAAQHTDPHDKFEAVISHRPMSDMFSKAQVQMVRELAREYEELMNSQVFTAWLNANVSAVVKACRS